MRRLFRISALHSGLAAAMLLALPLWHGESAAREIQKIAAIVNDEPISSYDLDQYSRLLIATSNIPLTPQNKEKIQERSLTHLIEDLLQIQEAKRLALQVPQEEVDAALRQLVLRNGLGMDRFRALLENNGVTLATLHNHLRADLIWQKVVSKSVAPRLLLSARQVDDAYQKALDDKKHTLYLLSEIFLGYDNVSEEEEARLLAAQIQERIRAESSFELVASQISEAPSAALGGDIGWVPERILEPPIREALADLPPRAVSKTIRTDKGYYMFLMRDRYDAGEGSPLRKRVRLISLRLPGGGDKPRAVWRKRYAGDFPGCPAAKPFAEARNGRAADMGEVSEADLAEQLRENVRKAKPGDMVSVSAVEDGIRVLILCQRVKDTGTDITRESVEARLLNMRASVMARQRLQEIRRDAHVEIR